MRAATPHLPAHHHPYLRRYIMGAVAVAVVLSAAAIGNMVTLPAISGWYASLEKPAFNPPNGIFGPVWSLLYALMGYAFWRVLILPAGTPGKGMAARWFIIQMTLNAAWSVAFFGYQSPLAGMVVIVALLAAIAMTMHHFHPLDRIAAWLMAPYLAWVSFATLLNAAILSLNG